MKTTLLIIEYIIAIFILFILWVIGKDLVPAYWHILYGFYLGLLWIGFYRLQKYLHKKLQ